MGVYPSMCYLALQPRKTCLHYHNAYGHQIWQDSNLPLEAPTHKVTWLFDLVIQWDHVTNKNQCISATTVPMETKLGRMLTYLDGFPWHFNHMVLQDHLTKKMHYISTAIAAVVPMTTKRDRMVTDHKGLPPIKSDDPLIKIMWRN